MSLLKWIRFFHLIDKATYKKRRQIEMICRSKYFDADWYAKKYHIQSRKKFLAEHYLIIGWKKGYNPSPLFDTKAYLKKNPDVKAIDINPLYHYEFYGKKEARKEPSLLPDQSSWKRFFFRHKTPEEKVIQNKFHDKKEAIKGPFLSQDQSSWKRFFPRHKTPEEKVIQKSPFFDAKWYCDRYPECKSFPYSAAFHFATIGWKKGYAPSLRFSTIGYQTLYPDIKIAAINPLLHFVKHGQKEGRIAVPVEHSPEIFEPLHPLKGKNILLVTHILNHTGAPILLLSVAKVLKSLGYVVTLLSPRDGDLRNSFTDINVRVIIDPQAFVWKKNVLSYLKKYRIQFVLCNTCLTATIYSFFQKHVPSILWIHDNLSEGDAAPILSILKTSTDIYVPSQRTQDVIRRYNSNPKLLSYPIEDLVNKIHVKSNHPLKIAVCASICARKGQDIFIDAICKLPREVQRKAQFIIVGEATSKTFEAELKQKTKSIPEIIWQECIKDSDAYHKFMDEIDVLCCPSREDPFPLVVIDAMMHGKPVIISDHVGQKDIITNNQNGFIFPSEDVSTLAKILEQLIQKGVSTELREKSRALFENRFSPNEWCKQFKKIMEDTCKKSS